MRARSAALVAVLATTLWGTAAAATLTVTVANIANSKGQVRIAVYDAAAGWLDAPRWEAAKPAAAEPMPFTFEVPPGTYAVAVLHDLNDNGKMDYRLLRLPKEPYGFSNGAVPRLGPPRFADAAFTVGEEAAAIEIELRVGLR